MSEFVLQFPLEEVPIWAEKWAASKYAASQGLALAAGTRFREGRFSLSDLKVISDWKAQRASSRVSTDEKLISEALAPAASTASQDWPLRF